MWMSFQYYYETQEYSNPHLIQLAIFNSFVHWKDSPIFKACFYVEILFKNVIWKQMLYFEAAVHKD